MDKEQELILNGTPDVLLNHVRSIVDELNAEGSEILYDFGRATGAPDFTKWDKNYFAGCVVRSRMRSIEHLGASFVSEWPFEIRIHFRLLPGDRCSETYAVYQTSDLTHARSLKLDRVPETLRRFMELYRARLRELDFMGPEGGRGTMEHQQAPPRAFLAHGGETQARDKVEEYLHALGVNPVIAEKEPSEGRSIDGQVEWCLDKCDCAVILATKGDVDGRTGEFLPRGNVCVEIGRCQERFADKIIYLLEEGTRFPSNINEKVWERFTQDNMERAFLKIARELVAFGLIKAVKVEQSAQK